MYALSLFFSVPYRLWLATCAFLVGITAITTRMGLDIGYPGALAMIAFSYVGQDVSHWLTCEQTFQSTYMKESGWMGQLLQHTFYLLPCVLGAIPHMDNTFLYWLVATNNVVFNKIVKPADREKLTYMRKWVLDQNPSKETTTHWWTEDAPGKVNILPPAPQAAFNEIATCDDMMDMFYKKFPKKLWTVEVCADILKSQSYSPVYSL